VELRPVKLNDAVANLTRMLNRIIGEHIRLQCRYAPGLPLILADLGMLDQIVMNLVVNARDAMPRGGELTLSTTLANIDAAYEQAHPQAAAGQFVCLSISDTGCGIPKENLTHIFEPFFTTKETGRGTGLGLSTVYGIVQQHQGWITVDSELDRGSMFRVYFPALHPLPSASIENQALRPATGGTGTILLVEDEAPLRLLTAAALERFGYKVIEADSGLAALTLWRENHSRIDAIVTDLIMPGGINGHELVESLRKSHPDLPAVYTSGYNPGTLETGSEALKGAIFVQKPYSPNQLAEAVRQALRK
jgi:two-component system cell cycle sensor histidine kinase/response regulator CckA